MFSLKRWRNTRGFGVHSPFGYDIARNVVRPGRDYGYYGYSAIEAACHETACRHDVRNEARMLLRLAATLRIDSAFLPTGIHPAYHSALQASNTRMRIERKFKNAPGCRLITARGDFFSLDFIKRHLKESGNVVALLDIPEGWAEEIFAAMHNGLMVKGKKNVFFIAREEMHKVAYDMNI